MTHTSKTVGGSRTRLVVSRQRSEARPKHVANHASEGYLLRGVKANFWRSTRRLTACVSGAGSDADETGVIRLSKSSFRHVLQKQWLHHLRLSRGVGMVDVGAGECYLERHSH